ncbi:EamA family transporter [bacterium]|nr:EamA family transporter [bacterium]
MHQPQPSPAKPPKARLDRFGLAQLAVVYVVWGSTYLAIRVAVREGAGFPPFMMATLRVAVAAAILLGLARLRRQRVRITRGELGLLAATGALLWLGGNGLVTVAERRADSGLAALLVAAMPIWAELIAAALDRRPPSRRSAASVLLGFVGVGVLTWPELQGGSRADVLGVMALLAAPLFWALGSIWLQRRRPDLGVLTISGWQQALGGVSLLAMSLLAREPLPRPTGEAWLAWLYLVLFGSVLAFTSYMGTLRRLPYRLVVTYTYANPVIAVFLGWLLLGERVTPWTLAGATLVVAGVAGVFANRD